MKLNPEKQLSISRRVLFSVYLIIPILVVVVVIDLLTGGNLRTVLPATPDALLFYLVLFELPHIIASFFSYADKEYINAYKEQLKTRLPAILVVATLIVIANPALALLAFVVYTMYHVFSQQAGIASTMMQRKQAGMFLIWRFLAIVIATVLYLMIYIPVLVPDILTAYGPEAILLSIFLLSVLAFFAVIDSKTRIGKQYFWATHTSILAGALFFILGYPVFAVLVVRFAHDITAFIFYIAHDHNRNRTEIKNWLYKIFSFIKIPIIYLAPLIAVAISYPFQNGGLYTTSLLFIVLISATHYYIEGFMWKKGSIHRAQIEFSD